MLGSLRQTSVNRRASAMISREQPYQRVNQIAQKFRQTKAADAETGVRGLR